MEPFVSYCTINDLRLGNVFSQLNFYQENLPTSPFHPDQWIVATRAREIWSAAVQSNKDEVVAA